MTQKQQVKNYLISEPRGRERANKDRALVNLLRIKYPQLKSLEKELLIEIVREFNNLDRYWRQTLQECPELRGNDYGDNEVLEQEKQIELGYEPGYNTNLRV